MSDDGGDEVLFEGRNLRDGEMGGEGSETRCQGDHTGSFAGVPLCSAPSMDSSASFYALFPSVSLGREERGTSPVSCNERELAVLAGVLSHVPDGAQLKEGKKERKKEKVKRRARERQLWERGRWWGREGEGRDKLLRCVPYREVDQCGQGG
jgi:hypothetical protein